MGADRQISYLELPSVFPLEEKADEFFAEARPLLKEIRLERFDGGHLDS